jgi:tRNA pseudouridine38-40 synthase
MVRNIVGCLVYVGKGKYSPEWLADVLQSRERRLAAPTFAPDGLYLRRISYDPKWELPQMQDRGSRIEDRVNSGVVIEHG